MVDQTPETTYCDHGRPQGGCKTGICPTLLEIETKKEKFLENVNQQFNSDLLG